jgi:hypothetical protein
MKRRDGLLVASGAGLMLIVLLVLQSFVDIGLFTRTVTTYNATYAQVANAYASHLTELNDRNVSALASGYQSNATVEWTGAVTLAGTYSGEKNIENLWGGSVGRSINFSVSDEHQSIGASKDDAYVVVNSTFDFRGFFIAGVSNDGSVIPCGPVSGSVNAQDAYENINSSWFITREIWNFTQFSQPLLDCFQ